ncbi:hypothetical protein B0H10DRAFT_2170043 [Mycena sp. CBHHK59/15]|nr:hypothetical protein B0H10DRAFT_2170043 [Mycena sp. CBHHK59/15]
MQLGIKVPKTATLTRLREELVKHCMPRPSAWIAPVLLTATARPSRTHHATPRAGTSRHADTASDSDDDDDEASLIKTYGVDGANSDELLGYDSSEDPEEIEGDEEAPTDDDDDAAHTAFKNGVRVETIRRAEGNRRAGGIKTQNAMVKAWKEFTEIKLKKREIRDGIVDEHSMLLFINYSAEREKKSRRGQPIPGTRLGASQLKKLFFGALRIRKQQDAANPTLAQSRPATTFITWEGIKCRMDESIHRVRDGHEENEDAPDIRANTFLPEVTDQQLQIIGYGFLAHRQKRLVIFGHLAWTCQHATGNRGDDFRALKLAELQPYTIIHPNRTTAIQSVLGLQGEEKAGKRGMRTVINPVYSAFIANKNPEMCPLGAFALYHHWIHDDLEITDTLKIDWSVNKSWRQIRILHGPKSPNTPYNEQNLYNLYCKAYAFAGFSSKMKAHLPRHLLGYRQEALGVDGADTAKLGWVRGQTYFDTYAPALPKKAILGAAGYQAEETYDPVWRHVHVPEQFLWLICPNAEEIHESIANKANLSGAANYWLMCGAAIFQKCPKSALFRLPAFENDDVRNWMKTTFPAELSLLQAKAGNPIDLVNIQNAILQKALEDLYKICSAQEVAIKQLHATFERRTAVLSPAQGQNPSALLKIMPALQTGTYHTEDDMSDSIRAFVNSSPKSSDVPRAATQVDLVLPPTDAFYKAGKIFLGLFPPLFGQKSARWPDVFPLIQQPKMCWAVWGPTKTVNQFVDVNELWKTYVDGEAVYTEAGVQTGMKPPLQLSWERYREIPQWIEKLAARDRVPPTTIIAELEAMRVPQDGGARKGMNWLRIEIETKRKQAVLAVRSAASASSPASSSTPTAATSLATSIDEAPDVYPPTLGPAFSLQAAPNTTEKAAKRKRATAVDARRPVAGKKLKL